MATVQDLLGVWRGSTMCDTRLRSYDVLVFKEDGGGFLDLYLPAEGFTELFRWSVEPPDLLRLEGAQLLRANPDRITFEEMKTTLNTVVPFSIHEEDIETLGPMRVLRFGARPWPGMSDRHLFYHRDIPRYATFQAPCFVLESEPPGSVFRGQALSDYLAQQLQSRHLPVSPMQEVFFGACYYRTVEVRGTVLGLAVNANEEPAGWFMRIDRPTLGGTVEAEELHRLLDDILRGVEGLHGLQWQTEEEWYESGS